MITQGRGWSQYLRRYYNRHNEISIPWPPAPSSHRCHNTMVSSHRQGDQWFRCFQLSSRGEAINSCCSNQHTVKWIQSVSDQISRAVGNGECWLDGGIDGALRPLPILHPSKLYIMPTSARVNIKIHFLSVTTTIFCQSLWKFLIYEKGSVTCGEKDLQTWFCCIIVRVPSKITERIFVEYL